MCRFIPPAEHVQKLIPYKTTEAWRMQLRDEIFRHTHHHNISKLDYNESPFPVSSHVLKAVSKQLRRLPLNWYPDPDYLKLKKVLSAHYSISPQEIIIANGSAEALAIVVKTYCNPNDKVLIISPTYDFVRYAAECSCAKVEKFFLDTKFQFDFSLFKKTFSKKTKVVYLVNPNNPTGTTYSLRKIKEIATFLQRKGAILIVDEAYLEFSHMRSAISLTQKNTNIVVTRTFSKAYGLANFRVGYIISHLNNVNVMEKVSSEFPINTLSELAAVAALQDQKTMRKNVQTIRKNKELLTTGLKKKGYMVIDSPANFVLVKVDDVDEIINKLAAQNIIARPKKHLPPLENFVRFSIGKKADIKQILHIM